MTVATFPPPSLAGQLAELKRERAMRRTRTAGADTGGRTMTTYGTLRPPRPRTFGRIDLAEQMRRINAITAAVGDPAVAVYQEGDSLEVRRVRDMAATIQEEVR